MSVAAVTETYFDVQSLLSKIAHKFHRQYGGDINELLADANYFFLQAYDRHDPEKEDFENWVRFFVWRQLLEIARTAAKRRAKLPRAHPDLTTIQEEGRFTIERFITDLSEDAVKVVRLVTDTASEIPGVVDLGRNPNSVRKTLLNYLKGLGWTTARIYESFNEITQVLGG